MLLSLPRGFLFPRHSQKLWLGLVVKEIQRQLAPGGRREVAERKITEAFAMEREHRHPHRREHPPHLVVFALGQRDLGLERRNDLQLRRRARLFLALQ